MKNTKLITRIICIVMTVLLVLSLILSAIPRAYADAELDAQLAVLNERKEEAQARRTTASNKLAALREEREAVVEEKMALEERNDAATAEIAVISDQIDLVSAEIADYDNRIEIKKLEVTAAQNNETEQLNKYRTRIRAMEENGSYNILALILNSDSFSSLLSAVDDYGDVMDADKQLYDNLQAARQEHQRIQAEYEQYKAECEDKKAVCESNKQVLEAEKTELERQIAESESELETLAEEIKKAEEEQAAAEAALASTSASISSFLAAYQQQKALVAQGNIVTIVDENGNEVQQEVQGSTVSGYDFSATGSGSWCWPFPNSYRISSTMKPRWGKTHSGVDIDGFNLEGSAIVAADAGTVIKAECYGGYGNCVIIDHNNGWQTLYGHLSSISVSNGQAVSGGQTIGIVGSTGTATGTHLHFEMLSNGSRVNPLNYYSGYVLEDGAGDPS